MDMAPRIGSRADPPKHPTRLLESSMSGMLRIQSAILYRALRRCLHAPIRNGDIPLKPVHPVFPLALAALDDLKPTDPHNRRGSAFSVPLKHIAALSTDKGIDIPSIGSAE